MATINRNENSLQWKRKIKDAIKNIQDISGSFKTLSEIKGLTELEIIEFEKELDVQFPEDYRAFLTLYGRTFPEPEYDGLLVYLPHFGDFGFLGKDQIVGRWKLMKEELIAGRLSDHKSYKFWNPKWIPIASTSSHDPEPRMFLFYFLVLDENSSYNGKIVPWNVSKGGKVFESFEEFMDDFFAALNSKHGFLTWDETYGFSF